MFDVKTCSKCRENKAITEFYTSNKTVCKQCINENCRKYYNKNADKIKAQHLSYCSGKRDYINARQQAYYAAHAEEVKAREARYKIEHADKVKARELKYRQNNPDRVKASQKRKFKKRMANDPDFAKSVIARMGIISLKPEIVLRDNNACILCLNPSNLHCHHIVSVMENPQLLLEPNNLVILCEKCHYKAHNNGKWKTINPELAAVFQEYIASLG